MLKFRWIYLKNQLITSFNVNIFLMKHGSTDTSIEQAVQYILSKRDNKEKSSTKFCPSSWSSLLHNIPIDSNCYFHRYWICMNWLSLTTMQSNNQSTVQNVLFWLFQGNDFKRKCWQTNTWNNYHSSNL